MIQRIFSANTFFATCMVVMLFAVVSCTPQSKEEYLDDYQAFITKMSREYEAYTEEQWIRVKEQYEKFRGEWYDLYKEAFTLQDQLLIGKFELQYNLMRAKVNSVEFYNTYMRDDFEKLRAEVKYYYENEMKDDLEILKKQAKAVGDSVSAVINETIRELEENEKY